MGGATVDGAPGLTGDLPSQHARAATARTTATPRRSPAPKPVRRAPRAVSRSGELRGQTVTANDALNCDDSGRFQIRFHPRSRKSVESTIVAMVLKHSRLRKPQWYGILWMSAFHRFVKQSRHNKWQMRAVVAMICSL